jgi:hypothetical protein
MRARNIKPGFFKNEQLAECEPLARILFVALWCLADREGRLEDRPKRIQIEALPYDACDCEKLLSQLNRKGLIFRYEVGAVRFIQIPKFADHQRPHTNETPSIIPPPAEALARQETNTCSHGDKRLSPWEQALRPDSLIPDSLIPDSLSTPLPPKGAACPYQKIIETYHEQCPALPRVQSRTPSLEKKIKARWNEIKGRQDIAWWQEYFARVAASDFLAGRVKDWTATFHWLLGPENMTKVLNGAYDNKQKKAGSFDQIDYSKGMDANGRF